MFCLRGLFSSAKDFYFAVVLLCAIFVLVSCKGCSSNEADNQLEFNTCNPYTEKDPTNSLRESDGHISSFVSTYSVEQHNLESICPDSNSFCFPSTLTEFSFSEVGSQLEVTEASWSESKGISSGLDQVRSNLSWPTDHVIFRFLDGRGILCSSYEQDDFHEFPFTDIKNKNDQQRDLSSCFSTIVGHGTQSSKSGENAETIKSDFLNGFTKPPVEIKPSVLDWGQKHLYYPSLAFLTVKNLDSDSDLSIHYPYSSNSQFYPCNFSEILLAPGEVKSICFVFSPRKLGLSSAQLVLQTSFGGFLIQAKGFAVESPYFIRPLSGFNISSSGSWRKNLSLFNPFNDALYVEEITAWISTSSGNTSRLSKAICSIHSMEDSAELSGKEWLDVESAEGSLPEIAIRPLKNWEVGSQKTETVMELDISDDFEGKILGAFCLQLVRSSDNKIETVIVPLEAELRPNPVSDTGYISVSLEPLIPCNTSVSVVALLVRNDGPDVLSVIEVKEVGDSTGNFRVKSMKSLVLFPRSVTHIAILSHANLGTHDLDMNCKLLVQINGTKSSLIEIPCVDVITVCGGHDIDSTVGHAQGINNVDYIRGREQSYDSSMQPPTEIKAVETREPDELVLQNWKSQSRASFMSVLDDKEVLFPMVQVGNHCSQWIAVKNPSKEPIVVQLILNSGEVVDNCRTSEMHSQPSSSSILVGNKSIAPTRYGFSIAKDAVTEALIHPYSSACFGPIFFQPSNRCEWRSSALIRNNLSGVEWLSLRGLGGSRSLVLLEGSDPVRSLEFKMNLPSQLNFSSPEILHSMGGKRPSCSHPLIREIYAKNMGDFPLEVLHVKVSGSECSLDGFLVHNCKGFTLPPGESVMLQISYRNDFSTASIQRDLELALPTGILVIPMKATWPIHLFNFCKKSMLWMRLKKFMIVILFAALLLPFLVCLLFPRATVFTFYEFKSGKSYSNLTSAVSYLSLHLKGKASSAVPPKMNGFVRSIVGKEESLLESSGGCLDAHAPDQDVNPSRHQKHKDYSIDNSPETRLMSSVLSNFSPVENSDAHAESDSRILRVKIGKEKVRSRRKKKSAGVRVPGLFEVSSSQSSNSTPSSPLSPATSLTPKRPWQIPLDVEHSVDARNLFSKVPNQQSDKRECSKPSSKVGLLKNEATSKFSAEEQSNSSRKVAGRAVLLPSATFPSAGRATPSWTCHSPILAAMSTIAPHARAPGTKLHNQSSDEHVKKIGAEEKFTYDIWGDHLFGVPLAQQSNRASSVSPHATGNNSESFFVRDPQTLMTNSLLKPVSSDLEGNK
ncbi:hypothetical protein ACS0TY_006117 [Phlomoides rotata]